LWFWCHGALGLLVVRDFPKFSEVEGVLSVFVVRLHYVGCLATSGIDLEMQSSVKIHVPSPCYSTGDIGWAVSAPCPFLPVPGMVSLRYSALLWQYPALPLSHNAQHGIVAVFSFAVVVSCFALISSRLAWYHCASGLHCGGILLRPYHFTPSVVSLRYLASLWRYPASPLSITSSYRWWSQLQVREVEREVCGER